jgi:HTH-type transcriptional repressor of NAD biosynthesis genes
MKKGIVLGKFMPLHTGHLALIDFARRQCDLLYVILCHTPAEPIKGLIRQQWIAESLKEYDHTRLIPFDYSENDLPNTSESSRDISQKWAAVLQQIVPDADSIFTSEDYGDYVAEYMQIQYIRFDPDRIRVPVFASQIRNNPIKYWDFIADSAKPYFVRKVVLLGSESTGKTTLTEKLAKHYNTVFVPEMAREIIEKTEECTYEDMARIAALHATAIRKKVTEANRIIFVDTDITTTRSYSVFLFNEELATDPWIEEANIFDLRLFLEPDCDYVQDGTRLSEKERNRLSDHHKKRLLLVGLPFHSIRGDWEERFAQAKNIVDQAFFI